MSAAALPVEAEALARRLRQAALGCTLHGHGPLNALVAIITEHEAGRLDGPAVCEWVEASTRARLADLDPDSLEATRERKVALIVRTVGRGLAPRPDYPNPPSWL